MDAPAAARVRSVRGMGRTADGATTVSIAATDVPPALRRMGRHRNAAATAAIIAATTDPAVSYCSTTV